MRKLLIGFMIVLVIGAALYFRSHRRQGPLGVAYAGNREVTLWSTTAQVREPVATANYGDRLEVLRRSQDQVQVRTTGGAVGWVSETDLLSTDVWQKAKQLESEVANSPVQARGHTHAISNLHVEAGRESPRIQQLNKMIPVDLFDRKALDAPAPTASGEAGATSSETGSAEAKKEDWWLVRAHLPDQTMVTGWILGRFVDLDVPAPLPDYASSAGMHIVAWFQLNRVADALGQAKPQYLLVGTRGPEGQPCDFTLMRVYTWGVQRQRYETAYVESDLCGKLPVNLSQATARGGDVTFSFEDSRSGTAEERTYRMHQTIVRRVREEGSAPVRRKRAHE